MKGLFTLIFLFQIASASAQTYYPLLRTNVYWDVFDYDGSQICNTSSGWRYFVDGDTLLNGNTYRIIKGHPVISLVPQPGPFCPPFAVNGDSIYSAPYFMREDTITQQIFVYDHMNNQEDLLFDCTLQVGDTLNTFYTLGLDFVIDSIGSFAMPDGSFRKIFNGSAGLSTGFYIEGVGSSGGLFHPFLYGIGVGHGLTCVAENNIPIYSYQPGCLGFTGVDGKLNESRWMLYPNPASNQIILELQDYMNGSIAFYDATGRLKHFQQLHQDKTEIPVNHLNDGIYFYRLKADKLTEYGKFSINKK